MKIRYLDSQLGLLNSTTRIPFRYGSTCLVRCPQATLRVQIEAGGKPRFGYSADCLPPGWFDKSPEKDYRQQVDEMLSMIAFAEDTFADVFRRDHDFFEGWIDAHESVHRFAREESMTPLLASFGLSMVERATIDALLRANGQGFASAARQNLFDIDAARVHAKLGGHAPAEWLPVRPKPFVLVRHTIGLADPLTASDDVPHDDDGFPRTLEQYVAGHGIRCLKIKVSNRLDHDLERLATIATIVQRYRGDDYLVTLDGNEQYKSASDFDALVAAIGADSRLATMWRNTLAIEQPLDRQIALHADSTEGIRQLSKTKPVIIDESDATLDSYPLAIELGYRGVSSKNCKGPIKSLLNAGLTWIHNDRGAADRYLMTGEDLCSVGVIAVQADLCLAATLGFSHVERNGHHYHRGLAYLPMEIQREALRRHGDLYAEQHGRIAPRLVDGGFHIQSLHGIGFGFAVEPDMSAMKLPKEWEFASLGL